MRRRVLAATFLAAAMLVPTAGAVLAAPDNDHTLHFTLYCEDGHTWHAAINGGSSSFHLDEGGLYVWKQIDYVTPDQVSGSIFHGIQGFSGAPLVVCHYTGALSGNTYTVTGFYPPAN